MTSSKINTTKKYEHRSGMPAIVPLTKGLAARLDLVLSAGLLDIGEHLVVLGALDGGLQLLEVVCLVQHLVSFGVEIADLADVLFAL